MNLHIPRVREWRPHQILRLIAFGTVLFWALVVYAVRHVLQ